MSGADKRARRLFNELRRAGFITDTDGLTWGRFKEWWRTLPAGDHYADGATIAAMFKAHDRVQRGTKLQQLTDRITAARDNPQQEFSDAE